MSDNGVYEIFKAANNLGHKKCIFKRIKDDWIVYECSNCNELWVFEDGSPMDNSYKYCPNCGFKIDEVKELEIL